MKNSLTYNLNITEDVFQKEKSKTYRFDKLYRGGLAVGESIQGCRVYRAAGGLHGSCRRRGCTSSSQEPLSDRPPPPRGQRVPTSPLAGTFK